LFTAEATEKTILVFFHLSVYGPTAINHQKSRVEYSTSYEKSNRKYNRAKITKNVRYSFFGLVRHLGILGGVEELAAI